MKIKSRKPLSTAAMSGFTLVEIMVSIVIVAALAAMIFLGATRMRAAADQAISVDNLRKLQLANSLYATDNNGRFVSTFTQSAEGKTGGLWDRNPQFLDVYVGVNEPTVGKNVESRVSPKHLDPIAYKARASGYDTLKASYGMVSKDNYKSGNSNVDSTYRMTELTSPSQTAAFVTAVNWLVQYGGRFSWKGEEGKVNAPAIAYRYDKHKEDDYQTALVVYYDGHVGEITKKDMKNIDSKRGGANNAFWKGTNGRP
jgi:prepilin-type N-terminal cleavage/methylation domain-containing protein